MGIDSLIIHSANDLEEAFYISELLLPICKEYGVVVYVAHNDLLIRMLREKGIAVYFENINTDMVR
ncbi:hypothetical protein [Clostridium sp. OS1-26]|uniref:hypothetical protein n=1 Tax=Clostridium sp. OS1-26 TaxID=3070681 RepID=UPI0027DEE55D|nr:hypothetical protein [Clostridium sp. OS1-26]WML33420.1 hypothetical protein RCG18_18995 [Clostridium sp. OS1-26]